MSILNVNKINPVGGGSTITIAGIASVTSSVTAPSFVGAVTGNVTGNADTASGLSGNPSINTTGIVTATSFVPTVGQLSHRNLIINGAMTVAQRGVSSTTSGYGTVDRFQNTHNGTDEAPTQAQVDVASGTTPYTLGFRKAFKITNGNQTSGAGAGDWVNIVYKPEAQDIANSGWNYLSSSSNITLSFWAKASVAQTYQVRLSSKDGTSQGFVFEYALSADTWTKVTKTIPGNSNLQFDNNTSVGMEMEFLMFIGTTYTSASPTLDAWGTYSYLTSRKDMTSTWYTTNDATFEVTGFQLEVGPVATPFEHRSFGDELARCQRYFYRMQNGSSGSYWIGHTSSYGGNNNIMMIYLPVCMRDNPSLSTSGTASHFQVWGNGTVENLSNLPVLRSSNGVNPSVVAIDITHNITTGHTRIVRMGSQAYIEFSAEL